jgi:DNA-binding beta-propeller fold protein YncE
MAAVDVVVTAYPATADSADDRPVDVEFERPIYVTNRGFAFDLSTGPHVVSRYAIDATGRLAPRGEPVATVDGARGIVFTPDAHFAYVVGENDEAVSAYRVAAGGELVPLGRPVPTRGLHSFGIAIAPDGRHLYVANLLSHDISIFSIAPSGRPTLFGDPVVTGVPNARNVAVSRDGRFLFVAHGAPPDLNPDLVKTFPIHHDGSLGPSTFATPIGITGTGLAISPDGQFLYVSCSASHDVHGFRIGPNGELHPVPHSPFLANNTPEGMAVTLDGHTLYVSSVATQPEIVRDEVGLWTFTVNADGSLTTVGSRLDAAGGGAGAIITPDGRHLLVTDFFNHSVAAYEAHTLHQLAGSPQPSLGVAPALNSVVTLPNLGPRASFDAVSHGNIATFDATASSDDDGRVARYDWNFGDGTTLADGGPLPSHSYHQPGTYLATLVVTDNEGCSRSLYYTGYTPVCVGSAAAGTVRQVRIGTAPSRTVPA